MLLWSRSALTWMHSCSRSDTIKLTCRRRGIRDHQEAHAGRGEADMQCGGRAQPAPLKSGGRHEQARWPVRCARRPAQHQDLHLLPAHPESSRHWQGDTLPIFLSQPPLRSMLAVFIRFEAKSWLRLGVHCDHMLETRALEANCIPPSSECRWQQR